MEKTSDFSGYVDERTSRYYASRAQALVEAYSAAVSPLEQIRAYLPAEGRALDIGAGSGRDLLWLRSRGYEAVGAEPSAELIAASGAKYPELTEALVPASLPELSGIEGPFDLILSNAVFQHLGDSLLFDSIFTIRRLLKPGGTFVLSVPKEYAGIDPATHRDSQGRYFKLRPAEEYRYLAERIGFELTHRLESEDSLGREGTAWVSLIFRSLSGEGRRPIEKIESVIREDRKTNTYKFALLRALGEIAVTTPHAARWQNDGYVALSLDYLAEKWLEYYWPILEDATLILQGARSAQRADIVFRESLSELIRSWGNRRGGLGTFKQAWLQGELPPELATQLKIALGKIKEGIKQPIRYAGTDEKIFGRRGSDILIDQSLWREFSLMGRWFEDSIILQWAQFSAGLKANQQNGISASTLIDTVFAGIEEKREVSIARQVYDEATALRCVWTDRPLDPGGKFDVDHVIPFSLWHNNNLWNLMPSDAKVNNQKRDKLPSRALLTARAPALRSNWELLYNRYRFRFALEAQRFMGSGEFSGGRQSFDELFRAFSEAVEVTALQRSVPRWEPA